VPYLEHLYCKDCGHPHNLDLDFQATIEAYQQEERSVAYINSATMVWDYMIYSCVKCKQQFKLTFRDVEGMVRSYLSTLGLKYKKYLDELAEYNNTEEERRSGDFFRNKDKEVKKRVANIYAEE